MSLAKEITLDDIFFLFLYDVSEKPVVSSHSFNQCCNDFIVQKVLNAKIFNNQIILLIKYCISQLWLFDSCPEEIVELIFVYFHGLITARFYSCLTEISSFQMWIIQHQKVFACKNLFFFVWSYIFNNLKLVLTCHKVLLTDMSNVI